MTATQYLSDYQIFSKLHGVASKHPKLKDLFLSNHLMPHNMFFQHTAAFWFQTSTGGADGIATSLWNGLDDATHGTLGEAKFAFDPGFLEPTGAFTRAVIPQITILGNDLHLTSAVFSEVANYSFQCIIKISNGAGTAQPNINGWALFFGKRTSYKYNIATPLSGKLFDGDGPNGENFQVNPLIGGVQVD